MLANTYRLVKRMLRGLLYCYLLFGSMLATFYLLACPCVPMVLVSPPLARKIAETIASYWEIYPFVLMEIFGIKVVISGDHLIPEESAIMLMNHRTATDWNFLYGALYQAGMPHIAKQKFKFILKSFLQHFPGFGWLAQINGDIFLSQCWKKDKNWLECCLKRIISEGIHFKVLIYPEGAGLLPKTKKISNEYAKLRGLPEYKYILHPRTTGFSYLATYLRNSNHLDAIYDFTIAYPDLTPQLILHFFLGKLPKEVHFYVKRIPEADIPKDEISLKSWLEDRWKLKEALLDDFYKKNRFNPEPWSPYDRRFFKIIFLLWTSLTVAGTVLFIVSSIFQLWVLLWTVTTFFTSITFTINLVEMKWYQLWKYIFKTEDEQNKKY